ncbi:MAG: protein TolR [bacterium]
MEIERKRYNHSHINIAPLVDVVFLLLLFFMLTSHLVKEPSIKINLPKSKTSQNERDEIKTVYITKEGKIFFMDKETDIERLPLVIKEFTKDPEKEFVRIKTDKDANVGALVSVIDEIRLSGIKNYSILAERR